MDETSSENSESQTEVTSSGKNKREEWTSQLDYMMASIGCCVGLGNIWRFPYLCYKNGGGAFLIPYTVTFFVVALPLFVFETTLGQYMSSGSIKAWTILPVFQGLGIANHVVVFYENIYYIIVIAWAVYYIGASFTSELPWATCNNPWNTPRCFVPGMNQSAPLCISSTGNYSDVHEFNNNITIGNCTQGADIGRRVDAVEEFFERRALQMSSGIDEPGSLVPGMTASLAIAWFLVYVCLCRGPKVSGKIVYVTALMPYILLMILLIRTLTLEGSVNGIVYYLKPDLSRLGDAQVWVDGATQVFYSMGLSQAYLITLGSYNKFDWDGIRNGLIITSVNSLTSLYGGLVVFAVLGFMAHDLNVPIDDVVTSGPGLIFLTYPKAVTMMPMAPIWSVLFFIMIFFVGIDSQFVAVEAFLSNLFDHYPNVFHKVKNRMIYLAIHCFIAFLIGLTEVTEGGVYVFRLFDYYSASGTVLLILTLCESLAIGWVFGADRYYDVIELMTGRRMNPLLKLCWKYFAPFVLTAILVFELATFKHLRFSATYEYPAWATVIGVLFIFSSCVCVPITFIYHWTRVSGSIKQRWRQVTTPILQKHMVHPNWKDLGYRWRLADTDSMELDECHMSLQSDKDKC